MSELTKRILFAVPAALVFLILTWLGNYWFVGLVIIISLFVQREMSIIIESAGFKPEEFFPYTIGLWILLTPFVEHDLIIGFGILLFFVAVQIFKTSDRGLKELINTFFCGIYGPLGLLPLILIRNMGTPEIGFVLTISLLFMVWGNDVFAYFGGKALGKNKMAPTISPNKTWEGFSFGILGALVGLGLVIYFVPFQLPVPILVLAPAAVFVSIFGPIGDLTASRMKRAAKVKDASAILPGHGGFFDRFDALILAAPAFYVYLYFLQMMGYVTL
ncbi:phosphatidate cytidylyltransferase [Fodinibius salinus]|uniref:Phosphatidate cytidylyltransferase n=1 Tax=Fodinibius salinus TaxID=860790 RepID=A0A5D3YHR1_9BACT|nr:phosphatidate cytidylyltransferase [Fodinibius salinus]TYP91665.1 phosphatidate cytidylyltransferase [Fodinibius salinus]